MKNLIQTKSTKQLVDFSELKIEKSKLNNLKGGLSTVEYIILF